MESKSALTALSALAQETRLTAFRRLVEAGPGGESAGALAEHLGAPAPTLSFHLKELERAGLIEASAAKAATSSMPRAMRPCGRCSFSDEGLLRRPAGDLRA